MKSAFGLIALVASTTFAAPIEPRQGAGVGAGCDSIFSDTDTMLGESVRGSGKTIAGDIDGVGNNNARRWLRRQGAGVGAGCDSILSDADTMIGESVRGSGKSLAGSIDGDDNGVAKRQLNGIADGATAVTGTVPGLQTTSESLDTQLNDVDGDGTNGSAELGQDIGDVELDIGTAVGGKNGQNGGSTGPAPAGPGGPGGPKRRQLNGIADGVTAVTGTVPGAGQFSDNMDSFLNIVDGQGTNDSAEAGEIVGDEELQIGQTVGGKEGESGGSTARKGPSPPPPGH